MRLKCLRQSRDLRDRSKPGWCIEATGKGDTSAPGGTRQEMLNEQKTSHRHRRLARAEI